MAYVDLTAGEDFEDWITRKVPQEEIAAGQEGQKAVICLSQARSLLRKRRPREYRLLPNVEKALRGR
jgi:hypothetical protein